MRMFDLTCVFLVREVQIMSVSMPIHLDAQTVMKNALMSLSRPELCEAYTLHE